MINMGKFRGWRHFLGKRSAAELFRLDLELKYATVTSVPAEINVLQFTL